MKDAYIGGFCGLKDSRSTPNETIYSILYKRLNEIRGDLPQKLAEYQRWTISRLLDRLAGEAR
jgi:hypothetical protein